MDKTPVIHDGKPVYPALLGQGIHEIGLDELEVEFVEPFIEKQTRVHLCNRFRAFLNELKQYKIDMIIWIDGSFCSWKPHPSDVDLVVFVDHKHVLTLGKDIENKFYEYLTNKVELKARYGCDVYLEDMRDEKQVVYYRGLFSFDSLNRPKGFVQLKVKHDDNLVS